MTLNEHNITEYAVSLHMQNVLPYSHKWVKLVV